MHLRSSGTIPPASGIGWVPSSQILSTFSYAAVWAGMYVSGAVVCLAQVAGLDELVRPKVKLAAAAFAFCTATGVYLLDRVKLRDEWLDPADAQAHPGRFAFIADHSAFVRGLMLALLMTAAWVGAGVLAWGAAVPVMAAAGVLVYAGRPRAGRPRPKDILVLKNVYVAAGITGFAAIVALAAVRPDARMMAMRDLAADHAAPLVVACVFLAVRVLADAVLCDLDDEEADRRFGTGTLPIRLGRNRAWDAAMMVRLCAAGALVMIPVVPLPARLAWAAVTVVSSVTMRVAGPARVRDWVDARFSVEAAVVAAILCLVR
jgi:4-hydroxybenzoate polyprenyltransferase